MSNIDLTIPEFLRRTKRLTQAELDAVIRPSNRPREWVMPNKANYEERAMAKIDFHVENRDAPVFVYVNKDRDGEKIAEFKNVADFEAWYRPGKMRFLGRNSTDKFTDVMLEVDPALLRKGGDAAPVRKVASPGQTRPKEGVSTGSAPRRYVDSRHVKKVLSLGFVVESEVPAVFTKGKQRLEFHPPKDGSAWSSNWTLDGKVHGKGMGPLFKVLK